MNWNKGAAPHIRTSLSSSEPSQLLGQNRLSSGFAKPRTQLISATAVDLTRTPSADTSVGESIDDPIELSDDSNEDNSEDGGMVINGNHQKNGSDAEMDEGDETDENDAHKQIQGDLDRSFVVNAPPSLSVLTASKRRLADLNPDELEAQLKYCLFHLSRDQIDLNRLASCMACLQEGHTESQCPEKKCTHCGARDRHPSRACPRYRRCTRCRERGHDMYSCNEKLLNTTVPCDYCGSLGHSEDTCAMRFFPAPAPSGGQHKLWISCANCASKTHLVGDCLAQPGFRTAGRWSLKSIAPGQVTNLSYQAGTASLEKEAMNRNIRPQGLKIRGRAANHQAGVPRKPNSMDDEEEAFIRPRLDKRNDKTASRDIRINGALRRPRPETDRYDRFNPPSDHRTDPRYPRDYQYASDRAPPPRRRRSRSPEPDDRWDSYRPPPSPRYHDYGDGFGDGRQDVPPGKNIPSRPPPDIDSYRPQQHNPRTQHPLPPRPTYPGTNDYGAGDSWRPPLPHEPPPYFPPADLGGARIQLPVRKGSNPNVNGGNASHPTASKKKRAKMEARTKEKRK